jgi:fumarate reductase subunit D
LKTIIINGREQAEHIKLLQGAFRSKIVLLLIAVVLTWGLWATLQHGDEKLPDADAECEKFRQAVLAKWKLPSDFQIGLSSSLTDVFEKLLDPKRPEIQKLLVSATQFYGDLQTANGKCQQITDQAYLVKVRVPYLLEPISINGLLLADFWPFAMIAIASAVVIFQLRERVNAIVLSGATTKSADIPSGQLLHVRSNYRVGRLQEETVENKAFLVYKPPFIVQPESLLVWTLLVLTVYSSFSLEATHRIEYSHEMTSVLFDYIGALWFYSVAVVYLVYRTWQYYERSLEQVFGSPVIGVMRFIRATGRLRFLDNPPYKIESKFYELLSKGGAIPESIWVLVALGTLGLPWMKTPAPVRGYIFLIGPKNLDESLATELQYQLFLAILFMLLCAFLSLARKRISEKLFQVVSRWTRRLGIVVYILIGNLFFHMLVLRIIVATNVWGLPNIPRHPLLFTDPGIGLMLFCYIFISLRAQQSQAGGAPLVR